MKKLFKKLILLLLITFAPIVFIFFSPTANKNHYVRAIKDKQILLKSTSQPKIVLIGDSNLPFGIDSDLIHRRLHYPVVNTGIYISLGLLFELNRVLPHIRKGDKVIISWVHSGFGNDYYGRKFMAAYIQIYPELIRNLTTSKQIESFLDGMFSKVKNIIINFEYFKEISAGDGYKRNLFNKYGDYIGHHKENCKIKFDSHPIDCIVLPEVLTSINKYIEKMHQIGAECYFTFPPMPKTVYQTNQATIENYHKSLQNGLKIKFLGTPEHFVFADSLFYDTQYHLIYNGVILRTEKLIRLFDEKI